MREPRPGATDLAAESPTAGVAAAALATLIGRRPLSADGSVR
jgi:hypothetical protein